MSALAGRRGDVRLSFKEGLTAEMGDPAKSRPAWRKRKPRLRRIVKGVVFVAVFSYVGSAAVLYFVQSKLVYHPRRSLDATPSAVGLAYEDVSFEAADGVKLTGWYIPAERPGPVVLICHGNAGNISHRLDSIEIFHALGLSVFIFDYRGYGYSEGKPTEAGTYLDAEAAWAWLATDRGVKPENIVVFGRSLGGAIAARLAGDCEAGALILESSFTSMSDLAADTFWFLPVRWLISFDYDTIGSLRKVRLPVLVVHSREDTLIPFRHGRRLFEAAGEPKSMLEITGTHNWGFVSSGDHYRQGLKTFLKEHHLTQE